MKNFDNMMFFSIRIVFVFLGLIFTTLQANDAWYFLPNFQYDIRGVEKPVEKGECFQEHLPNAVTSLIAPNSPLTEEQRKKVFWHSSKFPHRDYVKLMPERNTFGWYGCLFDIPAELHGLDIIVDLGIIDDTDEAFVNGKRIGGVGLIGKPNGLAWQTDRLYRIPNMYTITSNNYLAIHVWNLWGLGGIVGPPVLKASVVSSDAQWELAFVSKNALSNLNDIRTTEALFSVISAGEKIIWEKAAIPWKGYADWKDYSNYLGEEVKISRNWAIAHFLVFYG